MATAAAASPSSAVHVEIPGFAAISEQGHWDACGVIAELAALHACPWATFASWGNPAAISSLITEYRSEYVAAGRWGHGTTLSNIYWHVTQKRPLHLAGYIPYSSSPNMAALHSFIKLQTFRKNPVIVFISKAYNLTANEKGVYGHFVTLGGIDSVKGYLTANGDTLDGLRSAVGATIPLQWNTWAQLTAAGVNGAIALDASWRAPAVATPPPAPPASDSSSDALTLLDEALTALQSLRGKLA